MALKVKLTEEGADTKHHPEGGGWGGKVQGGGRRMNEHVPVRSSLQFIIMTELNVMFENRNGWMLRFSSAVDL